MPFDGIIEDYPNPLFPKLDVVKVNRQILREHLASITDHEYWWSSRAACVIGYAERIFGRRNEQKALGLSDRQHKTIYWEAPSGHHDRAAAIRMLDHLIKTNEVAWV